MITVSILAAAAQEAAKRVAKRHLGQAKGLNFTGLKGELIVFFTTGDLEIEGAQVKSGRLDTMSIREHKGEACLKNIPGPVYAVEIIQGKALSCHYAKPKEVLKNGAPNSSHYDDCRRLKNISDYGREVPRLEVSKADKRADRLLEKELGKVLREWGYDPSDFAIP